MTLPTPRPGIMDINPYVGGESKSVPHKDLGYVVRLASNEGALGPSRAAMEAYRALAGEIQFYPDGASQALREALALAHGLDAGRIVCGAGSDELIALLVKAYAGPGDEIVYSQHGFLMYPLAAKACGVTPVVAPEQGLTGDVDALLDKVTERTRLVFLANPNNPTGTFLPPAEIERLHAGLPGHVILVLDAAYAEYIKRNDYSAGIELVDRASNVVMLRTFSKIFAMGGLRLGWAYASAAIADVLNRVRGPFNVSSPAQAAAIAALGDIAFQDESREHNQTWREWTAAELSGLGLGVTPSVANFLLVDFAAVPGADAEAARLHLKNDGILVRQMGAYGLATSLRITIGREAEMKAVVESLTRYLAGVA